MTEQSVYWCEEHNKVFTDDEPCCEGLKPIGTIWKREGESE